MRPRRFLASVALGACLATAAIGQEDPSQNLIVEVSASEPAVAVGGIVHYRVTVTNQGSVPAYELELYCGLPTGQVRKIGETGPSPSQRVGDTDDAEEYLFRHPTLQPGARAEWSLSVETLAEGEAWIASALNAAGMDEPIERWVPTRVGSMPIPSGPLVLEATATPEEVGVGETITYHIAVTNQHHQALPNVTVRCLLPEGFLSFVPPEGPEPVEMAGPNQIVFRHPILNPAERASFTLVALAEQEGQARVSMWLNADGLGQPVEQPVDVVIWGFGSADEDAGSVRLDLTQVDPEPQSGNVLRLDLTVTNDDPGSREGLEVLCQVDPRILALTDVTGPSMVQDMGDGTLYIALPPLTGSATWRLTALALWPGEAVTAARLRGPSLSEMSTSLSSQIRPGRDSDAKNSILVTEDVDPITIDETVTYMVDVENHGATPLLNLEVVCQLDLEHLAFVSDYGPSPGTIVAEGQIRFTVPELHPGSRLTWRVTARSFSTGEGWMQTHLYTSMGHHGAAIQTTRIQP